MASQTLATLHPWLQVNKTPVSSGGHITSFSHDTGTGPVLVLVHGWPQSSYMWRHTAPAFRDQTSLFIPELPGYGFSSLPPRSDKRTVGQLLLEALRHVFPSREILWCGHDRGARVGHRLLVDHDNHDDAAAAGSPPATKIRAAVLMDIVPTTEQWAAFANPSASAAYYHWPFLAIPQAPELIAAMGGAAFTKLNLERARGQNEGGCARFRADAAVEHYAAQFADAECIKGSCADYAAGAGEDVQEQKRDQEAGRKLRTPTLVIYSAGNLGRMHDVESVWPKWTAEGMELRMVGIGYGYGHYLPEECPEQVIELPIPNVPDSRLDHAPLISLAIATANPDLHAILPRLRRPTQPVRRAQHRDDQHPLDAPVAQRVDRRADRAARRDDRIDHDRELRRRGAGLVSRAGSGFLMIRQVVIVLDRLQRRLLAVHAEVVGRDGDGEQGLDRGQHRQAGAQDGDQRDGRGCGRHRGICVAERRGVL
nr:fluoroacetate dehalogenase [Quercus suber]